MKKILFVFFILLPSIGFAQSKKILKAENESLKIGLSTACSKLADEKRCIDSLQQEYNKKCIEIDSLLNVIAEYTDKVYALNEIINNSASTSTQTKQNAKTASTNHASNSGSTKSTVSSSSSSSRSTGGTVHVKGYYRKDGTYVKPHTRRAPRR